MDGGRRRSSVVQVTRASDDVVRVPDQSFRRMSEANPDIPHVNHEAKKATENETAMTLSEAVKLYPKAIIFSIIFSTAVIMEGYDLTLMGSFYAFPPFKNKFGDQIDPEESGMLVSARWQTAISNGVQVGSIIGLYINGIVSEAIGYRKTMMGSLFLMVCFIFIPFFAQNLETLLAGALLQGLPWGVFQTLTTTYAAEICPTALRAYLCTYVNLCWVIGQLIAAGVLRGFLSRDDQWAYRIPFALQWFWPIPIFLGVIFAPESPWWLVRKERYDEAKRSLLALTSRKADVAFDADQLVSMMKATTELEKAIAKSASYLQCFRGTDARRTEIASMAWVIQAFCGAAFMGYSTQFYQRAGLEKENAFNMSLAQYGIGVIGTICAWWLMGFFGRRTLYVWGLGIMTVLLLIIGICGIPHESNPSAAWAAGSMLLIYTFVYDSTVGPVCYSLVAEIPSTRVKIKTVVLARNFYNMGGIINNVLMPQMIGVNAWNWGAKTGFFWAGLCLILFTWTYFRLPEPKGRTYGELDVLFEHQVSARKFASTKVDQFSGDNLEILDETDSNVEKVSETELKV